MTKPTESLAKNLQTIASYEDYAEQYNTIVGELPNANGIEGLRRVAAIAGAGGHILEIGSGPGRDADFLETLGAQIRRTDATQRFLDLQAARGKKGDLLNVITDDLGGPYDAVVALCVLIHVARDQIDQVLAKITQSLRPGGAFLVSMRDGHGEKNGDYHTIYWTKDDFAARIESAGMSIVWDKFNIGGDGDGWNTFLAVKPS
ncbi:class I SAM-dependent methyltransferase [Phyllobacterium sp. OV277]|uniref:class I SAM-dependent DNA methyltransferase n=1 Tax=Phyllobacterium sp. OV277 TaxID=1882772 RepID=UPI00088D9F9A|nr:class I SAM-dependent methyltransferase [Phyllobacterium sp. OV277]SDN93027.1 Methyltransferase domain-containing protein [Phyllobacterium sp. OV277]